MIASVANIRALLAVAVTSLALAFVARSTKDAPLPLGEVEDNGRQPTEEEIEARHRAIEEARRMGLFDQALKGGFRGCVQDSSYAIWFESPAFAFE